jgi:hypothetical protein
VKESKKSLSIGNYNFNIKTLDKRLKILKNRKGF